MYNCQSTLAANQCATIITKLEASQLSIKPSLTIYKDIQVENIIGEPLPEKFFLTPWYKKLFSNYREDSLYYFPRYWNNFKTALIDHARGFTMGVPELDPEPLGFQ